MARGFVIALLGAESTGKTTLAEAIAQALRADGHSVNGVAEYLREFCDAQRRTPRLDEQAHIADMQTQRIAQAQRQFDVVVADTTALMIAVYSEKVFGDTSLYASALEAHRAVDLTLVTALDLPWQADGLQRDGPQVRPPVDARVRSLLMAYRLPWALVSGQGLDRLESALDAVTPLLRERGLLGPGLFTRLSQREARDLAQSTTWAWQCDDCDVPGCEHALLRAAGKPQALPSERRQP